MSDREEARPEQPEDRVSADTDDEFGPDARTVAAILDAVQEGDAAALSALMEPLHAADIADLLEQIDRDQRMDLVRLYGREFDGEILSEIDEGIREDIISVLSPEVLSEAVRELDTDDVVDLIEDLDSPQQEAVLDALPVADRVAVERALTYPEYSAGRLMQRELVMGPEHWSVGEAIDYLREAQDLPDQFYHMTLVNPRMQPVANVTLGRILSSRREVKLKDIAEETFRTFHVEDAEADVAYAFNQYHLISAPVVDDDGRLIGQITIDDAMAVLDEEHEEDILRLAGVGEGSLADTPLETAGRRLPWLAVNLLTAMLSAFVISRFEDTIATVVVLAALMPIVASMGGNAGTQSLTVAVRGLATRDLTDANTLRLVRREFLVGAINGLTFATLMGLFGWLFFGDIGLGAVLAGAFVVTLIVAALAGILVPVALNRAGFDPALGSGALVTTLTDVVGFLTFLGLATMVLL